MQSCRLTQKFCRTILLIFWSNREGYVVILFLFHLMINRWFFGDSIKCQRGISERRFSDDKDIFWLKYNSIFFEVEFTLTKWQGRTKGGGGGDPLSLDLKKRLDTGWSINILINHLF